MTKKYDKPRVQGGMGKRPLVFLHIPKTGGTSVAKALNVPDNHWSLETKRSYNPRVFEHPDLIIATFIRNPWTRAGSVYKNLQPALNYKPAQGGFRQWVLDGMPTMLVGKKRNFQTVDQREWLGDLVPSARVMIGRFENLEHDFRAIATEAGYDPIPKLEHLKPHPYYTPKRGEPFDEPVWTDELVEAAASVFQAFATRWGYTPPKP